MHSKFQEQSKRDDLESWFYMSVEMVAGCLPWSHLMTPERELIARMKVLYRTVSPNKFLGKCLEQFDIIIDVIDEWDSKTQPDYDGVSKFYQYLQPSKKTYFPAYLKLNADVCLYPNSPIGPKTSASFILINRKKCRIYFKPRIYFRPLEDNRCQHRALHHVGVPFSVL
ncbi:hypothetical protein Tcan_12224 [Toxocara canis]|uniref:Uncharacterized protein n=1 Tax=Toxocara canis TaxID=6265 RepID=A0A0B2VYH5_TOXCA|nr:hypothetical protein Tcan_12224 [Toxocara canis]